jgi:ribosome maturation factor RimP
VRLEPVVRDALAAVGFELESLDVRQAGRRRLVRVVVDAEEGVGLDQVADASRAVSASLDANDELLPGPYTLEVTSPGVDRPLTRPLHWRRARYRLVRVRRTVGEQIIGRVGDTDDDGVVLLVEGTLRRLEFGQVERAVIEVEFRPPPAEDLVLLQRRANAEGTPPGGDGTKKDESR